MPLLSLFTRAQAGVPPQATESTAAATPAGPVHAGVLTASDHVAIDVRPQVHAESGAPGDIPRPPSPSPQGAVAKVRSAYLAADASMRSLEWGGHIVAAGVLGVVQACFYARDALPKIITGDFTQAGVAVGLKTLGVATGPLAVHLLPNLLSRVGLPAAMSETGLALGNRALRIGLSPETELVQAATVLAAHSLRTAGLPNLPAVWDRAAFSAEVLSLLVLKEVGWNVWFNSHRDLQPALARDPSPLACNGQAALCRLPVGRWTAAATHNAYATPQAISWSRLPVPGLRSLPRPYLSNQLRSVTWQLEHGFRGLSLEVSNNAQGQAYLSHNDWFDFGPLEDTMKTLANFLTANPRELLFLQVHQNKPIAWDSFRAALGSSGLAQFAQLPQGAAYAAWEGMPHPLLLRDVSLGNLIKNDVRVLVAKSEHMAQSRWDAVTLGQMHNVDSKLNTLNLFSWPNRWFSDPVNAHLAEMVAEVDDAFAPRLVMVNHGETANLAAIEVSNLARAGRVHSEGPLISRSACEIVTDFKLFRTVADAPAAAPESALAPRQAPAAAPAPDGKPPAPDALPICPPDVQLRVERDNSANFPIHLRTTGADTAQRITRVGVERTLEGAGETGELRGLYGVDWPFKTSGTPARERNKQRLHGPKASERPLKTNGSPAHEPSQQRLHGPKAGERPLKINGTPAHEPSQQRLHGPKAIKQEP